MGLLHVTGAREPAYTTAAVLEVEHNIARTVETLADRPGPTVTREEVDAAVAAKEASIGRALTDAQRAAVETITGSARSVEVIVGVAGSGKTTAVDAAAPAREAAGYRVIGASTSGQAARTLGDEAGIEARTLASLELLGALGDHLLSRRRADRPGPCLAGHPV